MTESAEEIKQLERDVSRRMRLLALRDALALALLLGGILAAGSVFFVRLRSAPFPVWAAIAAPLIVTFIISLGRWYLSRTSARDAAFVIDEALNLEDRIASAREVIERGTPARALETALIADAAERIAGARASKIVPHRFALRHALSFVGVLALAAAVMIPERSLPGGEARAVARADIQRAGEQLEQSAREVEQTVPPGSETGKLAKEQVELGRALRRSTNTRAEALKRLSALEERIRNRHDELANTRADEIVALAEKRFDSALRSQPEYSYIKSAKKSGEPARAENDESTGTPSKAGETAPTPPKSGPASSNRTAENGSRKRETSKPIQKEENAGPEQSPADRSEQADKSSAQDRNKSEPTGSIAKPVDSPVTRPDQEKNQDQSKAQDEKGESTQMPDVNVDGLKNLPGSMAEQAAKALPGMSEQLLKKAEQFRADQLKPEDVRQLALAAQMLARDLAPIVQSKEFRQAVEQLAREVTAEQIEQVARELKKNEELRKELEAAGRLLIENRQAKEMAAGLAKEFGELRARNERRSSGDTGMREQQTGGEASPSGSGDQSLNATEKSRAGRRGNLRGEQGRVDQEDRLTGRGSETSSGGKFQPNPGGEYLYLEARPGAGASRVPYTSAYPQYRRQAERAVERSQIPPRFRSVVRDYFDAINPEGRKDH